MSAIFICFAIDVFTLPGNVNRQVAFAGHGVDVAGLSNLNPLQGTASRLFGTFDVNLTVAELFILGLDHAVGEIGQAGQLLFGGGLLVFTVNLELLIVGIEQVDGEGGQMVEIVHAGLGDAEVCLTVCDPTDHRTHHEKRDQYQWQDDDSHLPADFEVVDEFEKMTAHNRINSGLETRRL